MIHHTRLLIVLVLLSPPLALGVLGLTGTHVSVELIVLTLISSLVAAGCWMMMTQRFIRLQRMTEMLQAALDRDHEKKDAIVEPLLANADNSDPINLTIRDLAERLADRRHQLRDTIDRITGIMLTLCQGRPIEVGAGDFDVPDPEDRTLLLGTFCQLINAMQQSKQRGDVFANVLRESPIAMLITDAHFKIRSLNPAAEKLFGFTLAQLLHHSIKKLFVPPPLKGQHPHLKRIVLDGPAALEALQNGRQEVFTTINTGYGKIQLIGLRASFGSHCLFVIRERSKDKLDPKLSGPDTIRSDDKMSTIPLKSPVATS